MAKNEIIKSFDSISSSNSYSKNGFFFEKILQYRSLKTLIKRLKHPIKLTKSSFLEVFRSKYPYASITSDIQDEYFSNNKYSIKNDKKDEMNNLSSQENSKNNNISINKKIILNQRKRIDYIISDPFKYSPNYNSIYKNIPSVKFFSPYKEFLIAKNKKNKINEKNKLNMNVLFNNLKEHNNKHKFMNNKNKKNTHLIKNPYIINEIKTNDKNQILTSINNNSQSIKNNYLPFLNPDYKIKTIKNSKSEGNFKINLDLIDNKNNHVLRFSKYVYRKDYLKINNNNVLSYINPIKSFSQKNIKTIDFKRMKPHSLKGLLNMNILKNPSICYYRPKYDAFIKKYYVIFNSKIMDKKAKGKNIMKKIWSSYNVHKEYLSIDNEKLNKCFNKEFYEINLRKNK